MALNFFCSMASIAHPIVQQFFSHQQLMACAVANVIKTCRTFSNGCMFLQEQEEAQGSREVMAHHHVIAVICKQGKQRARGGQQAERHGAKQGCYTFAAQNPQ
jgi:hypothetical protein